MDNFLEDFKKTFSRAAGKVAKKSGEVLETSKLTLAISAANSDIKDEYETIGKMVYAGYKDNVVSSDDVTVHCEAIDAKMAEIEEHRRKLNELKCVRVCTACNAEVSKSSTYCAKCGEKL